MGLLLTQVYEVGTLGKGDPCLVHFPEGQPSWFCRVASSLPYEGIAAHLMYECITPHGSVVITGAAWVSPMSDEDRKILANTEKAALGTGVPLYKGRIRLTEETT